MPNSSRFTSTGKLHPPIHLPISDSGRWLSGMSTAEHGPMTPWLRSALELLENPIAQINPDTNTFTIPRPISPVFIDNDRSYWNPTIIGLPSGSPAEYLLVARILTNGAYQQNVLCLANWTEIDQGLSCITKPEIINVAPTATRQCGQKGSGTWKVLANVPGFHDGRLMWTNRGEIMIFVGTQSRYTCFSLSLLTLSSPSFPTVFSINPQSPISFPTLTELSRPGSYAPMEKNWLLFFTPDHGTYVQYELSPSKRTISKLIGNGYTTPNLTSPAETPCLCHPYPFDEGRSDGGALTGDKVDHAGLGGWHQATNSLRASLCAREDQECIARGDMEVFIAIIQRKRHNSYGILSRYERVVVLWEGKPPFRILAIGKAKFLFQGETWSHSGQSFKTNHSPGKPSSRQPSSNALPAEVGSAAKALSKRKPSVDLQKPPFLFALSISYDHYRRYRVNGKYQSEPKDMYTGYLDDYLVVSLGIGDGGTGLVRLTVKDLISGLAVCPGFTSHGV